MRRKKGLLFFITSCVPGCGQMHQGYMGRGMSLLMAICAVFALAMFLGSELVIFMIPLWLYSFFDSYNLRSLADQNAAPPDGWLFGLSDMDEKKLAALCGRRHSLIGWALVLLGTCILYDQLMRGGLAYWAEEYLGLEDAYGFLVYRVPRMAVTVGIIALGVWFIRGPKQPKETEIPAFTPPTKAASDAPADAPAQESKPEEAAPESGEEAVSDGALAEAAHGE